MYQEYTMMIDWLIDDAAYASKNKLTHRCCGLSKAVSDGKIR